MQNDHVYDASDETVSTDRQTKTDASLILVDLLKPTGCKFCTKNRAKGLQIFRKFAEAGRAARRKIARKAERLTRLKYGSLNNIIYRYQREVWGEFRERPLQFGENNLKKRGKKII